MFESMRRRAACLSGPNMEADRNNLYGILREHKKAPPKEKPNWENSFQSGVKAYANKHHNGSLYDALWDLLRNVPPSGVSPIKDLVPAKWLEQPKKATTSFVPDRSNRYLYSYYRVPSPTAPATSTQVITATFPLTPTMPVRPVQSFDWSKQAVPISTQATTEQGQRLAPWGLPMQFLPALTGVPRTVEVSRRTLAWLVGRVAERA